MPSSLMTPWISEACISRPNSTAHNLMLIIVSLQVILPRPQRSLRGLVVRCLYKEYERAKKEKLCYHCLGSDHEKKICP